MDRENWQLRCAELKQRGEYLYKSKLWSDCEFQLNDVTIKAHKLLMAMASPVFAKMLYGGNGNIPMNPVPIFDVRVEVFDLLLQYIYSDNLNIDSTENAFELYNAAKKWRLPYIARQCMTYLSKQMSPNNVCYIYKVACESNDTQLQKGCEKIFSERTKEVLNDASFCNADLQIVTQLFSLDLLNIDNEMDLFEAAVKYANIQNKKSDQNALKRTDQSEDRDDSAPNDGPSPAKKPRMCDQESKSEDHDYAINMTLDNEKRRTETEDSPGKVSLASHGTASDSTVSESDIPEMLEGAKDEMGKLKYRDLVNKIRFRTLTPQEFADCSTLSLLLTKSEILALSMNISSKETSYLMPEGFSTNLVPRTQVTKEAREKLAAVFRSIIQNVSYSKKFESIPFYVRNTAWTLMTLVHNENEDILVLAVTCFLDSEPREWLQNTKIRIKFCTHKPVPKHLHKISLKFSEPTPEYAAWLAQIKRSELLNPAYGFLDDFNTVTYKLYINTAPGRSESPDQETLRDESTASIGEPDVSNLVLRVSKSSLPPSKGSTPTLSQPPVQNSERLTQKSPAFSQPLAVSQPKSVVSSVPASQQSSLAPTKVPSSRPSPIVTPPVASSRSTPVLTHPVPSSRMSPLPPTTVSSSRPSTAASIVNPHVASSRTTSASITSIPSSRPPPIVNPPTLASKPKSVVSSVPASQQSSLAPTKVPSSRPSPIVTPPVASSRSTPVLTHPVPSSRMSPLPPTTVSSSRPSTAASIVNPHVASSRTTSASITSIPSSRPPPIVNPPALASKPKSVVSSVPASQQSSLAPTKVPSSRPSPIVTPPVASSRSTPVLTHPVPSSRMSPLPPTMVSSSRPSTAASIVNPHVASSRTTSASITSIPSSRPPPIVNPPALASKQSPSLPAQIPSLRPPAPVTGKLLLQTSVTVNNSPMLPRPSPPVTPIVPSSQSSTAVTKIPASVVSSLVCPTTTSLTSESRPSPNMTAPVKSSQLPVAVTSVSALQKSIAPTLTRPCLAVTTQLTSSNVTSPILSLRTIVTSLTTSLRTTPNKATSVSALRSEPIAPDYLLRKGQLVNASLPASLPRQSTAAGATLPLASKILPTSTSTRPHLGNANQPSLPLQHLSGVRRIAHHHQQPFHLQSMVKSPVPSLSQYFHQSPMLRIPAPLIRPPSTIPVYEPSKLRPQATVNTPPAPSSLASSRPQSPQSLGNTPPTGSNPTVTPSIYQASRLQSRVNSPTHYFNRLLAPPYRTTLVDATDPCALASPNYMPNRPLAGFSLPQSIGNTQPTSAEMTSLSASSQVNTAPLPCVESISSPYMTTLSQSTPSPSDSDENMCFTPPSSSIQIMTSSEPKLALLTSSQSTADTTIVSSLSGPQIIFFSSSDSVSSSTRAASFARAASEELCDDVFERLSLKKLTLTKVNYIFIYHSEKSQSNDMTVQPISGSMSSSLGAFNTRPLREYNSSSARDSKDGSFNESHDTIIIPRVLPSVTTATASFQPLHAVTLPWPTRLNISKPVRSSTSGDNVISQSTSLSDPITSARISTNSVSSYREFSSSSLTRAASKGLFDKCFEPPSLQKIVLAELNSKCTPRSIDMAIRLISGCKTSALKPFISSEPESGLLISSRSKANTTLVTSLRGPITSATSTGAASKELFNKIYEPPYLKKIALAELNLTSKYMPGSNDMAIQPTSGPKTSILSPSNSRLLRVDEASFSEAATEQFDEIFEPSSLPSDSDGNVSLPTRPSSIQKISAKPESTANTLPSSVPGPITSTLITSSTVLTRAASEELFDEVFEPPSLKTLTLAKVNYIFIAQSKTSQSNDMMVQPISDSMSSSLDSFNTRPLCEDNGSFARDSKSR